MGWNFSGYKEIWVLKFIFSRNYDVILTSWFYRFPINSEFTWCEMVYFNGIDWIVESGGISRNQLNDNLVEFEWKVVNLMESKQIVVTIRNTYEYTIFAFYFFSNHIYCLHALTSGWAWKGFHLSLIVWLFLCTVELYVQVSSLNSFTACSYAKSC